MKETLKFIIMKEVEFDDKYNFQHSHNNTKERFYEKEFIFILGSIDYINM